MSTTITLPELYRPIDAPLRGVRAEVEQLWRDALSLVGLTESLSIPLGGKMLRPALCLLAAGAIGGKDLRRYVRLATAFEALHIASLAHDDVIDRALLRRGVSSLTGLWDNHAAILGGDYLVARSVEILAEYDSCTVIANAITSVRRMAEGELFFFGRENEPIREADCIMLAEQKTASLFAEACSAPAYVIDRTHRDALRAYGTALGIAFQIVDDLIDITQTAEQTGKPSCGDLIEGKKTIPIMYLKQTVSPADLKRIEAMRHGDVDDEERAWVVGLALDCGVPQQTETLLRKFADEAISALSPLPDSEFRRSMEGMVEFVLVRAY
ncbi:MAG: polyprenyl synthetase family protein [Candidatus Hydrogenedentes bacterium]|nr:polyprenyl synthetase family protein [Candidatus Hydrogenedentota bacterium]